MKKNLFLLPLCLILIVGCTKKENVPSTISTTIVEEKNEPVVAAVKSEPEKKEPVKAKEMVPAVMLWDEASFWTEKENNEMYWKITVDYGTPFKCYPKVSENSTSDITESKVAVRVVSSTKSKENKDFTKISYQNNDYWVQSTIIAVNAIPAIITKENTYVYKSPEMDKLTKTLLDAGTIIALSTDAPINGFSKISVRLGDNLLEDVYIKNDKFSDSQSDIQAVNMIKLINNTTDKAMKLELLENLKSISTTDEISKMVSDLDNKLTNGASSIKENIQQIKEETSKNAEKVTEAAKNEIEQKVNEVSKSVKNEVDKVEEKIEEKVTQIIKQVPTLIEDNGK